MTKRVVTAMAVLLAAGMTFANWLSVGGNAGSAQVSISEQNTSGTTFEVTVPGVEVTQVAAEGRKFSRVSLPGEVMASLDEGKPEVPKVSVLLAIPTGAQVSVRVLARETRTLKLADVYPLQPPLLDNQQPGPLVQDGAFYTRDVSYPAPDLSPVKLGKWRDLATAGLQVYPFKVNPGRGEVEVTTRIRVRVDYVGGSYPQTGAAFMFPMYAQYVDNFSQLGLLPETDYTPGVRYLVIGNSAWQSNSYLNDSLLGWVKQRGYDVRTIWKSSWTDAETKDSINNEYTRNNPKTLQFVLLVGEYGQIPMHAQGGVGYGDFWYSDLEPYSAGDNYPEVAVARISPSSSTDIDNIVKKILKYQKAPPSTNNWLDKYTMVAHSEQYPGKYSGCVRGIYGMPKPYWNPGTLETIMGYYTGNATVTTSLNAGRGIVAYRGHGDVMEWWSWGTEGSWYNSHVDALNNGDLTPVVYNVNCLNGDIATTECLAEKWVRKYPGGAVGTLGATQASYTLPNHGICSTLVRATTDTWRITVPGVRDYVGPYFHLSEQMMYFDAYVAKYWPSSPYPDNIYMYIMLGDPSMPVWSGGMPVAATVTKPDSIPTGPYNLNVTVQAGGYAVEGALVCAWKGTEVYVSERTDATGQATLAVNAATTGAMKLTVSEGHARHSTPGVPHTPILPYEGTINVGGGGGQLPNLAYAGNQVIDSTGNNNGKFDPGENGKLYVTLRNNGNAEAQNVTAVLSSNNGQFSITKANAGYGAIAVDSSKTNRADPFLATAGSGIPPGTFVTCTLKVHSDNFSDWTFTFQLQVGTPPTPPKFVADIDTGAVRLGVCAIGSIGYDEPPAFDAGSGFQVPKNAASSLFFGSMLAGNSETYVVDHFYSRPCTSQTNLDWALVDSLQLFLPPAPADERWIGEMSDAGHSSAKGLEVEHNWYMLYADPYNDWAVVTYDFTNSGSSAINGLYVGMIADFDVGGDPATNVAASDTVKRTIYMKAQSSENPTVGFKVLDPHVFKNLSAVDHNLYVYPDTAMTENMKWRFLSGAIVQRSSNRAYDWSVIASAGPFDLPVGGQERVAFAVVGINGLANWVAAADSAQSWYDHNLLGVSEEKPVGVATAERPLFLSPNPFRTGTFVHYFSRSAGDLELAAFDATGRQVASTTVAVKAGAGRHFWQPKSLARGIYFLKAKTPDRESVVKVLLVD